MMLIEYKEGWIDKLRYKKVILQRFIEWGSGIMGNANFETDQKNFFKKAEGGTENVGQIPDRRWRNLLNFGETSGKKMIKHLKFHG